MPDVTPGPALDAVVAEIVGWKWHEPLPGMDPRMDGGCAVDGDGRERWPHLDPADALAALLAWKGRAANRAVSIEFTYDGQVWVELFEEDAHHQGCESTLPLAVCAALRASKEGV